MRWPLTGEWLMRFRRVPAIPTRYVHVLAGASLAAYRVPHSVPLAVQIRWQLTIDFRSADGVHRLKRDVVGVYRTPGNTTPCYAMTR